MHYLHVRQKATFHDGQVRYAEEDKALSDLPPHHQLQWKDCPVGFLLLRDILLNIAPLKCWKLDETGDAFQGVTATYIGEHLCDHETCPKGMEFRAWIDERAEQAALLPTDEARWRETLSFLNGHD